MNIPAIIRITCATLFLLAGTSLDSARAQTGSSFTLPGGMNSLGMRFLPVPGTTAHMAVWETRVRDFAAFVAATGYDATNDFYYYKNRAWRQGGQDWRNPGFEQTDDHPVVGINWKDAAAFCAWLTETEHARGLIPKSLAYRIPTENEWTLAAGEDATPPYPENFGNYHESLAMDAYEFTSPVGIFAPNQNGFYDLAGNVWEFCLDHFNESPFYRVIRGGCWQNWHGKFVGVKARGRCSPDIRITLYGFRIVLADDDALTEAMRQASVEPSTPQPPRMY